MAFAYLLPRSTNGRWKHQSFGNRLLSLCELALDYLSAIERQLAMLFDLRKVS